MSKPSLSNQQIKALKSQAHALKPVVRIGQHGVTDAVMTELEIALDHHELLKVKVSVGERLARDEVIEQLARKTRSTIVQRIGNILVLYRKKPEPPAAKAQSTTGSKKSSKPRSKAFTQTRAKTNAKDAPRTQARSGLKTSVKSTSARSRSTKR